MKQSTMRVKQWLLCGILLAWGATMSAQKRYSLDELLEYGEQNDRSVAQAQAEYDAAKAEQMLARTYFFPQIQAMAGWGSVPKPIELFDINAFSDVPIDLNQYLPDGITLPDKVPHTVHLNLKPLIPSELQRLSSLHLNSIWVANLSLVQPLFTGGKVLASNQMADLALRLRALQLSRKRVEGREAIEKAYYQLVQITEQTKLLKQFSSTLDSLYADVQALYQEGYAVKSDLLELRLAQNKALRAIDEAETMLPLAEAHLAKVCSLPLSERILPADNTESLAQNAPIQSRPAVDTCDCEGTNANTRGQMLAIAEQIAVKEQAVARSEMMPQLAFFADYMLTNPSFFDASHRNTGGRFAYGITLKVPLTGIASGYYKQLAASKRAMIRTLEREDNGEMLRLERTKAQTDWKNALQNYIRFSSMRKDAAENVRLSREGYRVGVTDMAKLLRAHSTGLETEQGYIEALCALYTANAVLRAANQ